MREDSTHYKYLELSSGKEAVDLSDRTQFAETRESFRQMGFDELEISVILKIVCAILLLGNVEFVARQDVEGSAVFNGPVLEQVFLSTTCVVVTSVTVGSTFTDRWLPCLGSLPMPYPIP